MAGRLTSPHQTSVFNSKTDTRNVTSAEKRTFKDKLQTAILEAEQAEAAARRDAQLQDKKSLSVQLLVEGRPQAFIDFFSLTHQQPQRHPTTSVTSTSEQADLPQESLILLKQQLGHVEDARREGGTAGVEEAYGSYKHLAKYFAQLGRLKTAEFFFQQCLSISRESSWLPGELEANLALGVVYEQLNDMPAAIACHEKRLALANQNNLQAEAETALRSLSSVYMRQAEELDKAGDNPAAMASYEQCLRAADKVNDSNTAAVANHRLGMSHFNHGNWHDAQFYLRRFIDLASGVTGGIPGVDRAAEGVAHTSFAQCLKHAGDTQGAIASLESYLQTTSRGGDLWGPALASCSLGLLYYEQQDYDQACTHFERFFEVARTLPDKRALEAARFNLGVARGAARLGQYMQVVLTDLPKLIAWKNNKISFA